MKGMSLKKCLISSMILFLLFFSGLSGAVTHTISETVIGHAPLIDTHSYNNATPKAGDTLTINVTASDFDGDNITLVYQWLLDGNDISGETKASYTIRPGDTGHMLSVKVKGQTDPFTTIPDSTEKIFTDITLATPKGSAPVAANVAINGSPNVGAQLIAKYDFTDADNDSEGASIFVWYRDGVPIPGQTNNTYTLTDVDKGISISFSIIPVAATGIPTTGSMITSPSISNITDAQISCSAPIASIIDDYLTKNRDLPDYLKNEILKKTDLVSLNDYIFGNTYYSNTTHSTLSLSKVSCQSGG
jgi:hypothetical protein